MTTKTWGTRSLAAAAALGLVLTLGTASAGAGQTSFDVAPNPVAAGQDVTISGDADCIPDQTFDVEIVELGLIDSVDANSPWERRLHDPSRHPRRHLPGLGHGRRVPSPAGRQPRRDRHHPHHGSRHDHHRRGRRRRRCCSSGLHGLIAGFSGTGSS